MGGKIDIKELKRRRLTIQEKKVIKLLDEVVEYESIYFPNSVFFKCDNEVIFEKELLNKKFYINYDIFLKICLNGNDINSEKLFSNIEILLNEQFNLNKYNIAFTSQGHRSFWTII